LPSRLIALPIKHYAIMFLQKAESNAGENNRAMKAALNAELRKEKVELQQEVNSLYSMIQKKGLSADALDERREQYEEAQTAVDAIEDGLGASTTKGPNRSMRMTPSGTNGSFARELKGSLTFDGAYEHTEETREFVKQATMAQERQDLQLENIERGVETLKEIGTAMGDELQRHDVIIDEVEEKMDVVTREIQTNNMKLKGVLTQVRSSRKIFIDIILICILLAVGLYIYNLFK
jgi:SYP7 family syntaxin